jgi:predicted  nucleic acid-binding Zn-ribbon protein
VVLDWEVVGACACLILLGLLERFGYIRIPRLPQSGTNSSSSGRLRLLDDIEAQQVEATDSAQLPATASAASAQLPATASAVSSAVALDVRAAALERKEADLDKDKDALEGRKAAVTKREADAAHNEADLKRATKELDQQVKTERQKVLAAREMLEGERKEIETEYEAIEAERAAVEHGRQIVANDRDIGQRKLVQEVQQFNAGMKRREDEAANREAAAKRQEELAEKVKQNLAALNQGQLKLLEDRIAAHETDRAAFRAEKLELAREKEATSTNDPSEDLEAALSAAKAATEESALSKQALGAAQASLVTAQDEQKQLRKRAEEAAAQTKAAQAALETAQDEQKKLRDRAEEAEVQTDESSATVVAALKNLDTCKTEVLELREEKSGLKDQCGQLEEKLSSCKKRLNDLLAQRGAGALKSKSGLAIISNANQKIVDASNSSKTASRGTAVSSNSVRRSVPQIQNIDPLETEVHFGAPERSSGRPPAREVSIKKGKYSR